MPSTAGTKAKAASAASSSARKSTPSSTARSSSSSAAASSARKLPSYGRTAKPDVKSTNTRKDSVQYKRRANGPPLRKAAKVGFEKILHELKKPEVQKDLELEYNTSEVYDPSKEDPESDVPSEFSTSLIRMMNHDVAKM